jgi:Fe-S-cluster formation regulator IscX/YfhJ
MSEYSVYYKGIYQGSTNNENTIYEWAKTRNIFHITVHKNEDKFTPTPLHFKSLREWILELTDYVPNSSLNELKFTDKDFEL